MEIIGDNVVLEAHFLNYRSIAILENCKTNFQFHWQIALTKEPRAIELLLKLLGQHIHEEFGEEYQVSYDELKRIPFNQNEKKKNEKKQ